MKIKYTTRPYSSLILTSLAALAEEEEEEERVEVAANGHYGGYCDGRVLHSPTSWLNLSRFGQRAVLCSVCGEV
jgi:hypothetical protein